MDSRPVFYTRTIAVIGLVTALAAADGHAGDRAQPSVLSSSYEFDTATHLYTYHYVLSNPVDNTAPLDTLVIKFEPGVDVITDFQSPPGWTVFDSLDQERVMWGATGFLDPEADDPSGNIPPSDYAVPPGGSLAGFSFKSFSPPGTGVAITQSYAPLYALQSPEDFEEADKGGEHSTLPEENGFRLSTTVPIPDLDWSGNRRPAVDGFLVFANVQDKSTYTGSALVVLRLAGAGETVDVASLRVELNGNDVTGMFAWSDQYKGYAATFALGSSPIQPGPNVLRTSIEGIVPGTTDRRATDTDRLTFDFVP